MRTIEMIVDPDKDIKEIHGLDITEENPDAGVVFGECGNIHDNDTVPMQQVADALYVILCGKIHSPSHTYRFEYGGRKMSVSTIVVNALRPAVLDWNRRNFGSRSY